DSGKIWASVLKEAIKRRRPDFSESYYGFRTFGNLLEEAQARGLMEFGRDERSGAYVFRGLGAVAGEGLEPVVRSDAAPAERQSNAAGNQRHDFHAVAELSHAPGGSGDGGGGRGDRSRGRRGEGSTPSGATQQHANVRHNQQQTDRTDHQRDDAPAERQARTSYFTQPAPAAVPAPAQAQQPYRDEAADNAVAADERAEAAAAAMVDALGDAADSVDAAAPAPRRRAASAPRKGSSSGGRKPAAAQADAPAAEPAPSRSRKTATAATAKAAAAPHARKPRGDGKAAAKPAD
ncbi:OST-HTH/LOTUS domain-containing protein, partial [Acidovorax sp.]|uniref:OST-HTH/LOTUS domain-containing protein n=1 Tax=Acidovorax sp. TaxID=1872122 RepID=UPI00391FB1D3